MDPAHLATLPQFQTASLNSIAKLWEEARGISPDNLMRLKEENQIRQRIFDDAHSIYERNDGEVMARNTARRSELTAPERRESFWKDTEDRHGEPRFVGPDAKLDW